MAQELDDGCGSHRIDDIARHRYPAYQEFGDPSAQEGSDAAHNKGCGNRLFQSHPEDAAQPDDHNDLDRYENEVIAGRQLGHDKGGQGACDGCPVNDPAAFYFLCIGHRSVVMARYPEFITTPTQDWASELLSMSIPTAGNYSIHALGAKELCGRFSLGRMSLAMLWSSLHLPAPIIQGVPDILGQTIILPGGFWIKMAPNRLALA